MNLSLAELHQLVGGRLRLGEMPPREGDCTPIGTIVTDSRLVGASDVFWGLPGAKHDGSHHAEEALARGAAGVVTSGRWAAPWAGRWSLELNDSAAALWRLAAWNCERFSGRIVTIDGAAGKTTTSAMIAAVLNVRMIGETIADTDRPLSAHDIAARLVALRPHDDYVLIEMRDDLPSSVLSVGRLARPDIAIVTHWGAAAASFPLKRIDDCVVERLRTTIRLAVPVIVNGDDAHLRQAACDAANVVFVGRQLESHVAATHVECAGGYLRFIANGHRFCVRTWSRRELTAALIAVGVGRTFGLSEVEIAQGLDSYAPIDLHCRVSQHNEVTIIDDTGGGTIATQAAMDLLGELGVDGRRVMFCSDSETLPNAAELPRAFEADFGEQAVTHVGVDLLVACGPHAAQIAQAANDAGLPERNTIVCQTADDAMPQVLSRLQPGDAMLITGRRLAGTKQQFVQPRHGANRRAA